MNAFDSKARQWDKDKMHHERSAAIATELVKMIPFQPSMTVLEYGAGTGLLSFLIKDKVSYITMIDRSTEMVAVMQEKIADTRASNMKALHLELTKESPIGTFDLIMNQMVLHHIENIPSLFAAFYEKLNAKGYIAIADLYTEDGSFHDTGFSGHLGFDCEELSKLLSAAGFKYSAYKHCYTIKRKNESGNVKEFPIFLLVAQKE